MKHVLIVNGKPGTGKTTFNNMIRQYVHDMDIAYCEILSTIDPMKNVYRTLGWDGRKTDEARDHLSILKRIWVAACNGGVRYVLDKVLALNNDTNNHVLIFDIREANEIRKTVEAISSISPYYGVDVNTILIKRDGCDRDYNMSDDDVYNYTQYDFTVYNDSTMDELANSAINIIDQIMEGDE